MVQSLINVSNDVFEYMDALFSKAVKSRIIVRESFRCSFALFVKQLQTLFKQEVALVSKSVDDFWRDPLIELLRKHL